MKSNMSRFVTSLQRIVGPVTLPSKLSHGCGVKNASGIF
jgi:hypothetical protein